MWIFLAMKFRICCPKRAISKPTLQRTMSLFQKYLVHPKAIDKSKKMSYRFLQYGIRKTGDSQNGIYSKSWVKISSKYFSYKKQYEVVHIKKEDLPLDIEDQSIEIPDSNGVRQSKLAPLGVTLDYAYEDTKTLVDVFRRGYRVSENGPCLGCRDSSQDYKWLNYGEVIEKSENISYGLIHAGMKKGQDSHVGLYSQNCVEWVLVQQACALQSAVLVPLYDTLGPTACTYILNHVEAEFLVCDTKDKAKDILYAKENIPKLQHIVVIGEIDEELKDIASKKNVTIHQLKDIEESGKQNPETLLLPDANDLCTICYTSGTTGNPKGVMLTHGNFVVATSSLLTNIGLNYIGANDVYISYLTSAHVVDKVGQLCIYMNGGSVGFFRGDIQLLPEDIISLRPTMFPAVPRVLNKIYDKIQNEVNSNVMKRLLLDMALRAKEADLKKGIIRNNSFWDYLVLKKIRDIFGGRVRLLLTAGAPTRKEVLSFFKCSLGCPVAEGYGQTETAGATNCSVMGDYYQGTVGPPLSCTFMKLVDVPEMEYFAHNGEGEITMKGPSIMKGYFKDSVKTAEVIDEQGWLHSGDIGRWEKNGALTIIDRKKHLLKLSQGEYVSPEKIESIYMGSSFVDMIFVHGDSLENFLVAIVSPDKESLTNWCLQVGIVGDWNDICENQIVKTHVLKEMNELGKKAGLKGFEQVKAVYLYPNGFSLQNGILTTTLKVKREVCRKQFKDIIQNMYEGKSDEIPTTHAQKQQQSC